MAVSQSPIVINGSHGEGGSALLRTALCMSALTQQPTRIHNVRGATRKPGLTAEDLTAIRALAMSCNAEVVGDELESQDLQFHPRRQPRPVNHQFDIASHEKGAVPGNAVVVLETLLPVLARSGSYSHLTVAGETYNRNALTYDYFQRVTLQAHRAQGIYADPSLHWAGFGYAGKGEVSLEIEPSVPNGLQWESRGESRLFGAVMAVAGLADHVQRRGKERLMQLARGAQIELEVAVQEVRSRAQGAFVTLWGEFECGLGGGTAMGAKGLPMEAVVDTAFAEFERWLQSEATVDAFLADQLIIPAALADAETSYRTPLVTRRLTTISRVVKQFLPIHITVHGREGEPGLVTVTR